MKLLKYLLSILLCNGYRLLRFIPNNDPIMGFMLPYAKQDNWWQGALFAFITMVSFDFITMKVGIWTLVTASTYGGLAIMFHFIYKKVGKVKLKHYLGSGVLGVLIFDFITGPIMSSQIFGIGFGAALIGQIPFTVMHLVTVTGFILILTPVLDRALINNPALEDSAVLNRFKMWVRA